MGEENLCAFIITFDVANTYSSPKIHVFLDFALPAGKCRGGWERVKSAFHTEQNTWRALRRAPDQQNKKPL
jgi:hypothetical protein